MINKEIQGQLKGLRLVCQCCYQTMDKKKAPLLEKWNPEIDGCSHGICLVCQAGIKIHGYDKWVDMTRQERVR